MANRTAGLLRKYVPGYARNPVGLALRLLRTGNPAARSAMYMAISGALLSPVDIVLRRRENKLYEDAGPPDKPIVIIVGAPRSGTTLVAQYLINVLDVCYLNNLTSLFPRSPIQANRSFRRLAPIREGNYSAFYGKSRGLSGANDGLHVWDRWLGSDREHVPDRLGGNAEESMPAFFGALQALYDRPVLNKVNRLNTCANLVAEVLDNVFFLCLQREPLYLAQSLYVARAEIVGDVYTPYGTRHTSVSALDPVADVCEQVAFHENHARRQQKLLGDKQFSIVSYEAFCDRPAELAKLLVERIDGIEFRGDAVPPSSSFKVSRAQKVSDEVFSALKKRLPKLDAQDINLLRF